MKNSTSKIILSTFLSIFVGSGLLASSDAVAKTRVIRKRPAPSAQAAKARATAPTTPKATTGAAAFDGIAGDDLNDEGNVYTIDPDLSVVTVRMGHSVLGRFDTDGKKGLSGTITLGDDGKLTAQKIDFKVETLRSLIPLRDEHMKNDYLEMQKYPIVSITDAQTRISNPPGKEMPFSAILNVKGTPSPVKGTAKLKLVQDEILRGTVEFDTKVSAFPIKTPNYKGVGVKDEFKIIVELYARPDLKEESVEGF